MKFCTNCGSSNSPDTEFCSNCGEQLQNSNTLKQQPRPAKKSSFKKPMKRSVKILLILLFTLVVALVATHLILQSIYDPIRKINAMNDAYHKQDKKAFFDHFTYNDGTVASPENLYTAVSDYGWNDLRDELIFEAERMKSNKPMNVIYDSGEFILASKQPAKFGLYQNIQFTVVPTTVSVELPLKDTTFTFGGQEVHSNEDEELVIVGNFIPGQYDWEFLIDGGLIPMNGKGKQIIETTEGNEQTISPKWGITTVYIDSDLEDATVYINGKNTGKKVNELSEVYPAKINKQINMYAVGETDDGKEVQSKTVALNDTSIYLPFEHIQEAEMLEEVLEEVEEFYQNFREAYVDAVYYTDYDYIERFFRKGTHSHGSFGNFISELNTKPGYSYNFLTNEIISMTPLENHTFELIVLERFTYYSNAESPLLYERTKKYIISQTDDWYTIDSVSDLDTKRLKY
ncbi:zinc-ribbon domain-containing protein [Sporosarcina ureae]|uniref:TcaA NTF2-like domain-containing protein n=1 Tax=Sporosarcina ureae TaxID=1571 RepID=UPI0026EE44C4|nr:zinc-ribbon domain-containing protein [Sporosarcina ureae]